MYKYINPYNFIPFGDDLKESEKKDKSAVYRGEAQTNLLSGWLDVSMIIKSPLIIPDGAHPKYFDLKGKKYKDRKNQISNPRNLHLEYDFLKMYHPTSGNMEYGIPGSEIRGMIRSTYEAVTNSCVPFLQSDKPMSQRVPLYGALRKRGLLGYRNGHWTLYSTEKELAEVVVIPVYEAEGKYYIESGWMRKIRNNEENTKKDQYGDFIYKIMDCLNVIDNSMREITWKEKPVQYGAVFEKNPRIKGKWNIKVDDMEVATAIARRIDGYLFMNAEGSSVEGQTATYVKNKGWLQYNVPVDLTRIYHVAYLQESDPEHVWKNTKAKENEEVYKKLLSAIRRDGTETYRNGTRINNQVNRDCNFALENALNNACQDSTQLVPVYYFKVRKSGSEGELVYMSGSAAGRIAQRRKWKDIFEGHTPCDKKLCPACLLFGTIRDGGMKGHVRFSDAFLEEPEKVHLSEHTLQILSSPRATAFEFYLKKPDDNATYWNYDFYGVTEGGNAGLGDKTHTNYYHLDKATPRGRKMYWHHPLTPDDKEKRNMNNTHQSMDNGIFIFKVYFDQITKEQLKDLIWVISLGDNHAYSKLQHKIGHAKPLGYGSVKLLVKGGKIRKFECNKNGEYAYCMCGLNKVMDGSDSIKPSFDVNSQAVQSLLKMCDVDAIKSGTVDYPRTRCPDWNSERGNQPPIYEWFAENRTNPKTLVTLPEPTDSDINLLGGKKGDTSLHRMKYKVGDIVDAICDAVAENKNGQFGVFVKLQEKQSALLHRTKAAKMLKEYSVGMSLKVKIIEIKEENGRKKYSVTDKI